MCVSWCCNADVIMGWPFSLIIDEILIIAWCCVWLCSNCGSFFLIVLFLSAELCLSFLFFQQRWCSRGVTLAVFSPLPLLLSASVHDPSPVLTWTLSSGLLTGTFGHSSISSFSLLSTGKENISSTKDQNTSTLTGGGVEEAPPPFPNREYLYFFSPGWFESGSAGCLTF